MLWGLALFAPFCALLARLSPDKVNARKLLLGLMGLWAVPAMFVPLWAGVDPRFTRVAARVSTARLDNPGAINRLAQTIVTHVLAGPGCPARKGTSGTPPTRTWSTPLKSTDGRFRRSGR
jgi:hypothetical protein